MNPLADSAPPAVADAMQEMSAWWEVTSLQHATPQRIRQAARQRLQRLLQHARAHSPLYAQRISAVAAHNADLGAVAPVTKHELMDRFDDWATDRAITRAGVQAFIARGDAIGAAYLGRYAVWTSSGSTGTPGVFVQDAQALAVYDALVAARLRGLDSAARFAMHWMNPGRYALVSATTGHFAGIASLQRLRRLSPWLRERLQSFSVLEPWPDVLDWLDRYRPTHLATYPTVAVALAHAQRAGQLHIAPQEIWTGGEALSAAERTEVAAAFGCRVRNDYGASEFFAMAWPCEQGALHLNTDWVLLEPVDAKGRPVPPGTPSHTVWLTNLANHTQPLIRYDLGDRVTFDAVPCPCGSAFPTLQVEGRRDQTIVMRRRDGRATPLFPLALVTALEDDAQEFDFQLVQTAPDALSLRLDGMQQRAERWRRCRDVLHTTLARQGLAHVKLRVDDMPPQRDAASGKLRRVVAGAHTDSSR
jgi:phenylacetate-CoA ligase